MKDDTNMPDTEALILQAAEREFLSKGFAGARTTSIAEAAGVTHAMFHYYFRTKEKLFDRIITEKIAILKDALSMSVVDDGLSLDDTIRGIIDRHLDFVAANPYLPRFLVSELFGNSPRTVMILDRIKAQAPAVIRGLQAKIDKAMEEGRCRHIDARMLMLDIVSLNIFPYLATPMVNAALGDCMADSNAFLSRRKEENYDTIMRKIRP